MAPCNEMDVVRSFLEHSEPFSNSRKAFHELKAMLRQHNALPPCLPAITHDNELKLLLPDRVTCDRWLARYQATYGRIYSILDPKTLTTDVDRIYAGNLSHPVHVSKVLLAMAIAMQLSPSSDRLYGRSLARQVELLIHSSSRFQKPCIGVVQVHLLLIVLKTISASDTDKIYDLMGLHGITTQIVLNMGLHRDPALFVDVEEYHAEVRKRLWWCFVRLNLDYCVRSGTQFTLRMEESDCPFPSAAGLCVPDGNMTMGQETDEQQSRADIEFSIAAARLAAVIGPMQQALYSTKAGEASDPVHMQAELRHAYEEIVSCLPASLQPGSGSGSGTSSQSTSTSTDAIQTLQQSILFITLHSFLLIINLASTLGSSGSGSGSPAHHGLQRSSSLIEIWDASTTVLHEFQSLCQPSQPPTMPAEEQGQVTAIASMASHILWTDACRAVLAACWTVSRLREVDHFHSHSHSQSWPEASSRSHQSPQRTVHVFQQIPILTDALGFLSEMWKAKFHLGPVAAKTSLILAVTLNVTLKQSLDEHALMEVGVATAEGLVGEFRDALGRLQLQRQQQEQRCQQRPSHFRHARSATMSSTDLDLDLDLDLGMGLAQGSGLGLDLGGLSGLGIMTSMPQPACYSPCYSPSVMSASLSSPDMESVSVAGGSIYSPSWTAAAAPPTPSNTLLVPPRTSSGASSLVGTPGTPSLMTHEYFDLDFSAAAGAAASEPTGFTNIGGLPQQDGCLVMDSPGGVYGYGQEEGMGIMYDMNVNMNVGVSLNAYQGMEGMNGMSLWQ